jgi:pSer/pThr/pTyr-binding forkhead associated (FHA) protein
VVLADASVSRRHARLILSPSDAQVEDLDSKNGTRLNGERLSRVASLSTAHRIEFGAVRGTFEVDRRSDGSTATLDRPSS